MASYSERALSPAELSLGESTRHVIKITPLRSAFLFAILRCRPSMYDMCNLTYDAVVFCCRHTILLFLVSTAKCYSSYSFDSVLCNAVIVDSPFYVSCFE